MSHPLHDLIVADLGREVKFQTEEALRRMRYQQKIEAERQKGRTAIRRMMREFRRELWAYPDPIDRENAAAFKETVKKFTATVSAAQRAFEQARWAMMQAPFLEPIKVRVDSTFDRDLRDWQTHHRIGLSVLPPTPVAVITSPA